MSEKETTFPSLRNQDWRTVKSETEEVNDIYRSKRHHGVKQLNIGRSKLVCEKLVSP